MADIIKSTLFSLIAGILISGSALAQSQTNNIVVGTVGSEEITYSELKKNYRTNEAAELTLSNLQDFLPVYLDYKAKLKSARDNGYYSDPDILAEYQQYAKQAAYAYWLEKEIREEMFSEYYERAQYELKAFHILMAAEQNISEEGKQAILDTLASVRTKIENGEQLEDLNRRYSSFRNGRSMGGNLPWFTVGRTVREFEDAAYDLEIGETSGPVRTQFGFHLITLLDKRERSQARRIQHIFIRPAQDSSDVDKINEAYQKLEAGNSWSDVVQEYSMDQQSKRNAGLIGWVNYGSNVPETIVDIVMELDPAEEFSKPVSTSYGYHIFRIDSVQSYTEEERKQQLKDELENTPYFQRNNSFVVDYLQEQRGSETDADIRTQFKDLLAAQESTPLSGLDIPSDLEQSHIYTFGDQKFMVSDYYNYLVDTHPDSKAGEYNTNWYQAFTTWVIDKQIVKLTIERFPEFEQQTQNYLDGLIIYEINDDSIWSSATVDTTRLMTLYQENSGDYQYPKHPYYFLFSSRADSNLNKVREFITEGNAPDSVRSEFTSVGFTSDSVSTFTNEPFNQLEDMEANSFSEIFTYNNRKALFYLAEWLPARKMTFEEAFNRLLSDYQPQREQQWLQHIRNQYSVKPDYESLNKAFKQDPALSQ